MESGISARQQVAQNLADTCVCSGLNDAYGVSIEKSVDAKNKSHWSVLFCKARVTDGVIRVYSPGFILITWQTAKRDLPRTGKQVCRSEAEAKDFIINNFM
jgi:hypothetical protein